LQEPDLPSSHPAIRPSGHPAIRPSGHPAIRPGPSRGAFLGKSFLLGPGIFPSASSLSRSGTANVAFVTAAFFDGTSRGIAGDAPMVTISRNELHRSGRLCTEVLNFVGRYDAEPEFVER
jgi:hypothetical protein